MSIKLISNRFGEDDLELTLHYDDGGAEKGLEAISINLGKSADALAKYSKEMKNAASISEALEIVNINAENLSDSLENVTKHLKGIMDITKTAKGFKEMAENIDKGATSLHNLTSAMNKDKGTIGTINTRLKYANKSGGTVGKYGLDSYGGREIMGEIATGLTHEANELNGNMYKIFDFSKSTNDLFAKMPEYFKDTVNVSSIVYKNLVKLSKLDLNGKYGATDYRNALYFTQNKNVGKPLSNGVNTNILTNELDLNGKSIGKSSQSYGGILGTTAGVFPKGNLTVSQNIANAMFGKTDDIDNFKYKLQDLKSTADSLGNVKLNGFYRLQNFLKTTSTETTAMINKLKKFRDALTNISKSSDNMSAKFMQNIKKMAAAIASLRVVINFAKRVFNVFTSMYKTYATYYESVNLFAVSLGEYASEAYEWATKISDALYLDPSMILQYTGEIYNLTTGMGIASETAYKMSKNLTQLGIDMASYLNIDYEAAYAKIVSAISGQSRAVVTAGVPLQIGTLDEFAKAKGIEKSVSEMTQAEKTILRYLVLMESSKTVLEEFDGMQMDLGRTLASPENATKALNQQLQNLWRTLGYLITPVIRGVLPYLIAFTQLLQEAAITLAKFFKIDTASWDFSNENKNLKSLQSILMDTEDTAEGIGDSIKRSLAPFDDLNVVESESSGSGTGSAGSVLSALEGMVTEYDILSQLSDQLKTEIDAAKKKLEEWIPVLKTIVALFIAMKISKSLLNAIVLIGDILTVISTIKSLPIFAAIGSFLSSIPKIAELPAAISNIGAGIAEWVSGGATFSEVMAAMAESIGTVAAALGGIIAIISGIVIMVGGIKKILDGDTFKGIVQTIGGIALIVAGVGLLFGNWIVAAVAAVVAIVAVVIYYWDEIKAFFVGLWEGFKSVMITVGEWLMTNVITPVGDFFVGLWTGIVEGATSVWNGICSVFSAVANFFDKYVIQPIIAIFSPIVKWFWELFKSIYDYNVSVISNIIGIAKGCWEIISLVFGIVAGWFYENVITPVGNFFIGLWNTISGAASTAWNFIKGVFSAVGKWFYDTVISPVSKFFSGMWDGFVEGAKKAWKGIKDAFSSFKEYFKMTIEGAWTAIKLIFTEGGKIFDGITSAIAKAFVAIVNLLIKGINSVISAPFRLLNAALRKIRDIEILGITPFKDKITEISIPAIPLIGQYAEGGMPNSGDLFWANENGAAEYITSIGNRTAVANQDQMIQAISGAITTAMGGQTQQRGNVVVYIGNDKVYEGQGTYQSRQSDRYGTTYVKI